MWTWPRRDTGRLSWRAGMRLVVLMPRAMDNTGPNHAKHKEGTGMTPREQFIAALERRLPAGHVPHFELVFFLTMEAFGKVHPLHRQYDQWDQMTETERRLHREDMADIFIDTARRYAHSAIFLHPFPGAPEAEVLRLIDTVRDRGGDGYFLMLHGDATYEIPTGDDMMEFTSWVCEAPEKAKAEADRRVNDMLGHAERL